jgi:hypothetical protein
MANPKRSLGVLELEAFWAIIGVFLAIFHAYQLISGHNKGERRSMCQTAGHVDGQGLGIFALFCPGMKAGHRVLDPHTHCFGKLESIRKQFSHCVKIHRSVFPNDGNKMRRFCS